MHNPTPDVFFDLSEYCHRALFDGKAFVWEALDNLSEYLAKQPLGQHKSLIPAGVFLDKPELVYIGEHTTIEPGAYLRGPCWIGDRSVVRHGAYIRGWVVTGSGCTIGHDTEVKNTIFLNDVQAAHFAYLGDSILGNRVNLGAGTKCANLKLDHSNIVIRAGKTGFETGRRKLGAILGDGTQLGCNTVTNPGTLTEKSVFSYPCTNFGGWIPAGHTVCPSAPTVLKKRSV